MKHLLYSFYLVFGTLLFFGCSTSQKSTNNVQKIILSDNWYLQSSKKIKSDGKALSSGKANTQDWYKTQLPRTVLASLIDNEVYKDIFKNKNLENIPTDQFNDAWWYVTNFSLEKIEKDDNLRLQFDGINYSANIWLNGKLLSGKNDIYGAFNRFTLDITEYIKTGQNTLAIELFPPQDGDFTIGFVDWAPTPPDNNMGIWRDVSILINKGVSINQPFVLSELNTNTNTEADLEIRTELINHNKHKKSIRLLAEWDNQKIEKSIKINGNETKEVILNSNEFKELHINNPRLWWPNLMGKPEMYEITLTLYDEDNIIIDQEKVDFGIRKVEDYFTNEGHRGYKINGKPVLIKGAGWVDQLLLTDDSFTNETQVKYVKDMNMNCIRFEGFWGTSDEIYKLCDKYGILAMVGFSCHWEWQAYLKKEFNEEENFGGIVTEEEQNLVASYLKHQVQWLRNRPSIFVWTAGSDFLPRPSLEKKYMEVLAKYDPTRPYLGAAKMWTSDITGSTGVKMEGPYDYVTPNYWYTDTARGGAFGFNTETGPGPQPPVLESMKKMISEDKVWPLETDVWKYHNGRHEFGDMSKYLKAFDARYGKATSIEDFAYRSQIMSYEAIRPMFEAFITNRPKTTGIIQWMLNSAWPETFWQQYDYYLYPTGAYYGTKKACEPLNITYNYGDKSIYVLNEYEQRFQDLRAEIKVYSSNSKLILEKISVVDADTSKSSKIFEISEIKDNNKLYFIDLKLISPEGEEIANNFYWLSSIDDVVDPDYKNSSWVYTPNTSFSDMTYLNSLPKASVEITTKQENGEYKVALSNISDVIAFGIELKLFDSKGELIVPIFWTDNYISLLPGETKEIKTKIPAKHHNDSLKLVHRSINID